MLQEAVNNCLRCIKCAEASYSGLLWMCVLPHLLPRGIPFVLGYKKNKSQLIVWKIIPAWSTEAYCRQHLLKMQVKLHTYHWGIQWNSMVMQVKRATFQRMKSGGKGRTESRWEVSGAGELHHRKYVLYFHGMYIKKMSERRQICSWWHCRAQFCKRDFYFTPSRTSNPSRGVTTNCHSPLPCALPVTVCWDLRPCQPNYTASH